ERAGDGDALLLAAGKLRRVVMLAALQPDLGQRLGGAGGAFGAAHALVDQRKLDVFLCRGAREEVEALEDEAEVVAADERALVAVQLRYVLSLEEIGPLRRPVEKT